MAVSSPPSAPKSARGNGSADLSWRLVRAENRPAAIVEFEELVVAFYLESAVALGVPKSVAAIYGMCFASPEPLSFTEVRERLNISAGSISQGLKVLREIGALKVIASDGDRRELFTPDLEMRKLAARWLEERLQKQLDSGRGQLQVVARSIPIGADGSAKILRRRLKALQSWHDKTRAVLPLVRTFLKLT